MTEQINVLGHIYARDTIGIPTDSLKSLMSHDLDKQFLQKRLEILLAEKRYAEADALLNSAMAEHNGHEVMQDILALQQSTNGAWNELNEADKGVLREHAEKGKAGAAHAAAILMSIGAEAPLPAVAFPTFTKSRGTRQRQVAIASADFPTLACFPNPTATSTFLTYPDALEGSNLLVHDAKGALVQALLLKGNGLVEIDTQTLQAGLYNLTIAGTSLSTKLNVQR